MMEMAKRVLVARCVPDLALIPGLWEIVCQNCWPLDRALLWRLNPQRYKGVGNFG
jgi:hypothetical protein